MSKPTLAPSLEALEPRNVPATLFGLAAGNQIVLFESDAPETITETLNVTGVAGDLVGIDFRPIDGQLIGVAKNGVGGAVYTIDPFTGAATQINTIGQLNGSTFGVDFNPVPNALRIVSDEEQNLRITMGGAGTVNSDAAIRRPGEAPGTDSFDLIGTAYNNNTPGGAPGGVTTIYNLDAEANALTVQGSRGFFMGQPGGTSPNTGLQTEVLPLGFDFGTDGGFDISASDNTAFATLNVGGIQRLYTLDLLTGAATDLGQFNAGLNLRGLTLANTVVQFDDTTATVAEDNGALRLSLTRTNGAAGAVSVDVATADGGALGGQDFAAGPFTVFFADGQSTATVEIPLLDDASFEGDEQFSLFLTNPQDGARLGANQAVTVTVTDRDAGDESQNSQYVQQLYIDLLGRRADADGLAAYTARLDGGDRRDEIVESFLESDEYLGRVVDGAFLRLLGRNADQPSLDAYVDRLQDGDSIEEVLAEIYGSDEFFNLSGGTDEGFLADLFTLELNRPIDDAARQDLLNRLSGNDSRTEVAEDVVNGDEADRLFVAEAYNRFLRRPAAEGELVTLGNDGRFAFLEGLLSGDEYFNRFAA